MIYNQHLEFMNDCQPAKTGYTKLRGSNVVVGVANLRIVAGGMVVVPAEPINDFSFGCSDSILARSLLSLSVVMRELPLVLLVERTVEKGQTNKPIYGTSVTNNENTLIRKTTEATRSSYLIT